MDIQTFLRKRLVALATENTDPAKQQVEQFNSAHTQGMQKKKENGINWPLSQKFNGEKIQRNLIEKK